MPFFKRTCLLPWQSLFTAVQEEMLTVMIAPNPSSKKNFFITFFCTDDLMLVYLETGLGRIDSSRS